MSVAVVRSHADEPDPRVEFAVELRILIGAAVVRDLDHVDAGHGEPPAEVGLRLLAEVAEQRGAGEARPDDVEGDAGVVTGFGAGRRAERLPPGRADGARQTDRRGLQAGARRGEAFEQPLIRRFARRAVQDDRSSTDQRPGAADVVEVEVREHEQIDPVDAEGGEAAIHRGGLRTGVDEGDRLAGSPERRIALADVAHRDLPCAGHRERAADGAHGGLPEHQADHHGHRRRRQRCESRESSRSQDRDAHRRTHGGEQGGTEQTVGPRQVLR